MKILFLTSRLPYPPHRGDKLHIFNVIKQLSRQGHEINLISFIASRKEEQNVKGLMEFCSSVKTIVQRPTTSLAKCLLGLFSALPFQVLYFSSRKMSRTVSRELAANKYDLIHVHLIRMAQYGDEMAEPKRVLDLTDAGSLYLERFLKSTKNPFMRLFLKIELGRLKRYERILDRFDVSLVCSEVDAGVLHVRSPRANIDLLYNGIDLEYFSVNGAAHPDPGRIIYAGNMSYYPNIDGALFLINEIFPKIKRSITYAKLYIVGQNPPPSLRRLGSDDIIVTGFVPDVRVQYLQSVVAVAPIRFGAGTLYKILEPMALGIPVVATSVAAEGLAILDGKDVLIADSADGFAESVIRVLNDSKLQISLGSSGQSIVRNKYDSKIIAGRLDTIYHQVLRTPTVQ
jgi:sugar transferase (PEP-CTERM/EpsH1 system associated)